ncbi:GNAT family N-acetyltransferase [Leucobacter massiliensis]|uniref:Uncharacterized protein n=1 Tax=Leucobacter massiliensis TaxID=1686285 RepID=A0A2S9QPA8_9MICO|nr:GNAT family N-acetyltransferase [Leucobacter massiliensis]PRI11412.1 hypothetical protein B4915_06110 [Leucobacter massiliensis]
MNDQHAIEVTRDAAGNRFVIRVDGHPAGFAQYRPGDGSYDFTHTEIDPAFTERGLGSVLVERALEQTRELGVTIVPHCPFVAGWLRKHPEFVASVTWPEGRAPIGETGF